MRDLHLLVKTPHALFSRLEGSAHHAHEWTGFVFSWE